MLVQTGQNVDGQKTNCAPMTTESKLKKDLALLLTYTFPGAVIFKHSDAVTAGIPDLSITWEFGTVWLELKHVTPKKRLKSRGIQRQTAIELARFTPTWYVIYAEEPYLSEMLHKTYIIHPKDIDLYRNSLGVDGHNHYFVADFLRQNHELDGGQRT